MTPYLQLIRGVLALVAALAATLLVSDSAQAATITRYSSMSCNQYRSVVVHFPELRTSGGTETVYFSPDLWRYTSGGWIAWDTSKPWYRATVGPNGIYTINGYKWFLNQTPYQFVPFRNLTPGWYAVKGYFYGGSSHWANLYGTSSYQCYVP